MEAFDPHTGEDLRHVVEVSLHGALLDTGAVVCQCNHSDAVCEHLEVWDGVRDPEEVWGDSNPCAEVQPSST